MALAFRLYGKFHWPPATAVVENPVIADGVVEIHFDVPKSDAAGARRAWLRWYPRKAADANNPPPPEEQPTKHLFDGTIQQAIQDFTDTKDSEYAVWLDPANASVNSHDWLIFRGAFLFEQYLESDDGPVLDVQWPLVTECQYRKDGKVYSVLGIHYADRPLLYFNFNLPFPVRRTSLDGGYNVRAFPFSAVYSLAPVSAQVLDIDTLVAGWTKGDVLPVLKQPKTTPKDTSFPIDKDNYPKERRLGRFGLSEYGRGPADFALYNRRKDVTGQYWPLNRQAIVQDILRPYGFSLPYGDTGWLSPTMLGIADSSLRFSKLVAMNGNRSHRSSLIYRATVGPNRTHSIKDSELRADKLPKDKPEDPDKIELRLRLEDELGGRIADGTQFGLQSDDGTDVDGWLSVSSPLSADCELSWEIARENIWSDHRDVDWSPTVTIRLHWHEEIKPKKDLAAPVTPDTVFRAGLLAHAAQSAQIVRRALSRGEAGLPHSLLPDLAFLPADNKSVRVRFSLYGSPLPATFDGGDLTWGRRPPNKDGEATWRRSSMRLSVANKDDLIDGSDDVKPQTSLDLVASEQTFFEVGGVTLNLRLSHDQSWPPSSFGAVDDGPPFFASFAVDTFANKSWKGRLSSLQFTGSKEEKPKKADKDRDKSGHLRIGGRGVRAGLGAPVLIYPNGRAAAEFNLAIRTGRVEPIGIDVARSDRSERPAPLLIPLATPQQDGGNALPDQLWLVVTETVSPSQDRRIQADVYEDSQETGDRSYVVLSSEPFTIYRFAHRSLYDRGDASNASVAEYSGDDRIWQYKRVSEYYHYILPPQAVGESADKPRRLEIHDLVDEVETPPRPFLYQMDGNGNIVRDGHDSPKPDDTKRRAVEFRLTPPAEIWIRPSDVERGYYMPESTSYEIFRQRGEYGVGAALGFLRAEFLYGLSVGVDVSKEHGIARGARVAEIEALTGKLTGAARETNAEVRLSARWNALRNAVARRPERLEVWARDLDSTIDFTPARFSDGAQFALRSTALHRAPLVDQTEPENYEALPKAAVANQATPSPRYHPQGLSGGALWPVESLNLFKRLLNSPQSNGGTIESIALSPTGGDAAQKAEFIGGKVRIISETRNGYVQRQQVEVLGRICAFWHRAKHVVVYERTVNLPAQFAPKKSEDPKKTRSRRPILRKVREYIELLQPERNYPDFTTAAQRSAGFLQRVRFNSKIINVDSAWASDVGDFGWQIPLWNRLSARERPQVYPMPDIAFVSACEGEGEKPVVAQECLDPDYLFFFADFSDATTADTDTWESRLDLDFPNMPTAKKIADHADKASLEDPPDGENGSDGRRRSVGRILPGLRRFTWRLAPAAQKAAINAGRAAKPVYAGLDSVSFMRATHATDGGDQLNPQLAAVLDATTKLAGKTNPPSIQELTYWASDGAGGDGAFQDYSKGIVALKDALKAEHPSVPAVQAAIDTLTDQWKKPDKLPKALTDKLTDKFKEAGKYFSGSTLGSTILQADKESCAKLKDDAIGVIKRKEMLVRTALHDWAADAEHILPADTPIPDRQTAIEALLKQSVDYLAPLFDEAGQDVGNAAEGVEKARATVLNLEVELGATADRAVQRINQFVAGYDRTKPWSDERRLAFHSGLRACASNIPDDVAGLIDEARQHFAVGLNDASQAIGEFLAKALHAIADEQDAALSAIGSLGTILSSYFNDARDGLDKLVPKTGAGGIIEKAITKINDAITAIDNNAGIDVGLKNKAKAALNALKALAGQAKTTVTAARTKVDNVEQTSNTLLNQGGSIVKTLGGELNGVVASLAGKAQDVIDVAKELSNAGFNDIRDQLLAIWPDVEAGINKLTDALEKQIAPLEQKFAETGTLLDFLVESTTTRLRSAIKDYRTAVHGIEGQISGMLGDVQDALGAVQSALAPSGLLRTVVKDNVLRPAIEDVLRPITDEDFKDSGKALTRIRETIPAVSDAISAQIDKLDTKVFEKLDQISAACAAAFDTVDKAKDYLGKLAGNAEAYLTDQVGKLSTAFDGVKKSIDDALVNVELLKEQAESLIASINAFDHSVRGLQNDLARSTQTARMYADRVFNAASRLGEGGLMAAPNNILKLYSAVTTAPEIAALKADIDRIRSSYDELSDIVETTRANALFNRLGDELKALGLSLPFDKIGDRLLPANLPDFDIAKVFRNFGGTKLDNLLNGYKIPSGVSDAVRVTHDFDKKQARAWVQVDIDAPMGGRRSLFSIGVFKADFVDMRLTGQVRLDASKDQDKVTETGYGRVGAIIDLVVGGQSMVRFEKFALNFTRENGLHVEFDPKSIRLNPSFQFIQDFLGTLFPGKVGGLEIIKMSGIPIGVQHTFALPPISLNFGTSGVSNISIENHFKLLAFPDFLLADRFNLSTVERPFIFSIFIIGGTGYIQIEAEYRPFDSELSVTVEAGAGGSASLAFAFGPFVGQVFITLSGALSYRKVIGRPGGGLSISAVLVICGHVDVCGIVTVGIVLMLRMTYRDSGEIDADGTLTVEIRISKFFKITARAGVTYKMRGGKSETTTSTDLKAEPTGKLADNINKLQKAAKTLDAARK